MFLANYRSQTNLLQFLKNDGKLLPLITIKYNLDRYVNKFLFKYKNIILSVIKKKLISNYNILVYIRT